MFRHKCMNVVHGRKKKHNRNAKDRDRYFLLIKFPINNAISRTELPLVLL